MSILRLLHTAKETQVLFLKLIQQSAHYWNKQQIKFKLKGL